MDASDTVLPSSRQPMPLDAKIQAEHDKRRSRTADEIEADLTERTERLATNIDALVARAKPGNLVRNGVSSVTSSVTDDAGNVKKEVVGAVVGALVVAGVLVWAARRRR